jgi:hypothetical protein
MSNVFLSLDTPCWWRHGTGDVIFVSLLDHFDGALALPLS